MPDDIMDRVIRVIAEAQRIPAESISPDSTFQELKIDSLDGLTIIFAIENEFSINVPDDDAKSIRTVRDLADGIRKLTAADA
jgi:acyl carrier protein